MNELAWLTEHRPEAPEPDSAWARASLLAHIEAQTGDGERTATGRADRALVAAAADELAATGRARRDPAATRRPSRRRAPRRAAAVAVLALAVLAAMVAWPTGDVRTPPVPGLHAPAPAEAALVTLSKRIAREPTPTGDATLVLRHHHFPNGEKDMTGADLYLDDGRYIYAPSVKELRHAAVNGDYNGRLVKAAVAARTLPTAEARMQMILASGIKPEDLPKNLAVNLQDNYIWGNATDALQAGAGRKDVREGVMRLLATLKNVKVTEAGATLELTNTDFDGGYTETYILDATTGIPQRFIGGVPGQTPGVTMTFEIKRVTGASLADAAA